MRITTVLRVIGGLVVLGRFFRTVGKSEEVRASDLSDRSNHSISVVIPARDEAARIGGLLDALQGARGIDEIIVVDDESSDDTATIALRPGVTVLAGTSPPERWVGKSWALQQGVDAASGEWIVTFDSDTRPSPLLPELFVDRCLADSVDFATIAGSFECPSPGSRWLHPAMLTTLIYRFGAPAGSDVLGADRVIGNGQCMAFRREPFVACGGFGPVSDSVVEDVAIVRHLGQMGWSIGFVEAPDLLTTRMYESLSGTWLGWGRSIGLPGAEPWRRQLLDLVVLFVALPLPQLRLLARRFDAVDAVLLAARVGVLAGTARSYRTRTWAYWVSPVADIPAFVGLILSAVRRDHEWRGRRYPVRART